MEYQKSQKRNNYLAISLLSIVFLQFPYALLSAPWSGIIDPTRAIDWSNAGTSIPANGTVCSTLGTAGQLASFVQSVTAAQINTALASAACKSGTASNPKVVQLNAGTYNLTTGIVMSGLNNIVLRGAGANQTLLVMSGTGGCAGQAADVCVKSAGSNWFDGPDNTANFSGSGPWPKGTTQITLSSVANLKVGSIIIFDQVDDLTDSGTIYSCEETPNNRPGQNPNCNDDGANGGESGAQRGAPVNVRGQQQIVTVTGISGNTITFSPGLYMPNWRASQSPGAWWDSNPVSGNGVEDLSIQHAAGGLNIIVFSNVSNSWVKGVRSVKPSRAHVSIWTSAKITVRDSYFYQTANGVSQSYGVETFGASDILEENNIYQQVAGPQMFNSDCEGCVAAYNFSVNDYYSASFGWLQQGVNFHSLVNMVLLEGNVGSGLYSDRFHGTAHFDTMFRNRFDGYEKNGTTLTTGHSIPMILYPFSRYMNVIGNVLGDTARHTVYQSVPGNHANEDQSVYLIGTGADAVPDDAMTLNSLMRWGNYDVVNKAVRFQNSEVPSGLSLYSNPVPASQTLPASLYMSTKPSWWPSAKPWPPIGPDVAGGNIANVGGHAYTIPAQDCYLTVMGGPADGTGNLLSFNASTCYTSVVTLPSACDVNLDGVTNVSDVQLTVNQAIGAATCTADINNDAFCNVIDVQRVVNAALGGQCVTQ
jgi:hypothetical protein